MYKLIVVPGLADELQELRKQDLEAAAAANVLLQELAHDQETLEYLGVPNYHYMYEPSFETKIFGEALKRHYNILIVKFRDDEGSLPPYRILLGVDAQRKTYYALTIAHRSASYRPDSDDFRRLLDRYELHGIPKLC